MKQLLISFLTIILTLNSIEILSQSFILELNRSSSNLDRATSQKLQYYDEDDLNKTVTLIKMGDLRKFAHEGELTFSLPNSKSEFHAAVDFVETNGEDIIWNGNLLDEKEFIIGTVSLFQQDGKRFGQITSDRGDYEILELQEGLQILLEKDMSKYDEYTCGVDDSKLEINKEAFDNFRISQCTNDIDILYLYTSNVSNAAGSPSQRATIITNNLNQASRSSGITAKQATFRTKGVRLLSGFTETNNIRNDRDGLRTNSTANSLRDQFNADVVVLLTNGNYGSAFGIAYFAVYQGAGFAYCIADINAPTNRYTPSHEVGHIMGCKHDNHNGPFPNVLASSRGKRWNEGSIPRRTILARAGSEGRIRHFSNPVIRFNGIRTGDSNSRNNARQIRNQATLVANFWPDSDPFSVFVSGPTTIWNTSSHFEWCADIPFCVTPLSYNWDWSSNGYSYQHLGVGDCVSKRGDFFNTSARTIFIRVTARGPNGKRATRVHRVTNRQDIYQRNPKSKNLVSQNGITMGARLYPNPASKSLQIKLDIRSAGFLDSYIVNELGQMVKNVHQTKFHKVGEVEELISLEGVQNGLHYFIVHTPDYDYKLPFIKIE